MAAGLYLPTSDIDLVVMDSKSADVRTALYAVSRKLSERQIARDVQVGSSPVSCLSSLPTKPSASNLWLHAPRILSLLRHPVLTEGCSGVTDSRPYYTTETAAVLRAGLCSLLLESRHRRLGFPGKLRRVKLNLTTQFISIELRAATRPCCQQSSCLLSRVRSFPTPCKRSFSLAWECGWSMNLLAFI